MAIAFDASSSVDSVDNTDLTLSHTCSGSDRLLMVVIPATVAFGLIRYRIERMARETIAPEVWEVDGGNRI